MRIVSLLIYLLLTAYSATSQTAEEILDKYLNAIGTKEKWLRLQTRIDKYQTKRAAVIPNEYSEDIGYNNVLLFKVAKRNDSLVWVRYYSVHENFPNDTSTSCFNGKDYWFQVNEEAPTKPTDDLKTVSKNSSLGYPDLLLNVDNYTYLGNKEVDGNVCYVVRITKSNKNSDYYFNPETWLLVMYHPEGSGIKTRLSDYREVQGLKIPFRVEISNEYGIISSNQLVDIKLNVKIEDEYFSKLVGEGLHIK